MKQKPVKKLFALLALLPFFIAPSYSGDSFATQKAAKRKKPQVKKNVVTVIELRNIDQLKEAFQRDAGKVRFVTILSPT